MGKNVLEEVNEVWQEVVIENEKKRMKLAEDIL